MDVEGEIVFEGNNSSTAEKYWSEDQSSFLLEKYSEYIPRVGPLKSFRTKKLMWEKISTDMINKGWTKTAQQAENKYKGLITGYKKSKKHNRQTGNTREVPKFQDQMEKIASIDDSIQPEFLQGVGAEQNAKKTDTNKMKPKTKTLAETLYEIHLERQADRRERHQENLELIRSLFGSTSSGEK